MPSLNIPARAIPQGVTQFGPVPTGAGLSGMELDLDIGNLVAPCTFRLEIAFDGIQWQNVSEQTVTGPPRDKQQNLINPPTMRWSADFGRTVDGPVLTNARSQARLTIDNEQAFNTSGGTLTTS